MSNYDEFDDCEWAGPYCSSKKAGREIRALAARHGLAFTFNAGGGEFYRDGWRCQISTCDDVDDLAKLRAALVEPE